MLKVYGKTQSGNVLKVVWCLGELGLPFEREELEGPFGASRRPQYLALNPSGLVPTLVDGDTVLWESNTIVRYLTATYGAGTLYASDARERADADRWMDWQQTTVSPAMVPVFYGLVRTPPEDRDMAAIAAARERLAGVLAILDGALAGRDYVAGQSFTMGDIPLGVMAYRWFEMDIEREDYTHLAAWYGRLRRRPAYRKHVMVGMT